MDSAHIERSTQRQPNARPRYGRLRSPWARWGTLQVKAAQAVGDHDSAALFLALIQGLADLTVADVRASKGQ